MRGRHVPRIFQEKLQAVSELGWCFCCRFGGIFCRVFCIHKEEAVVLGESLGEQLEEQAAKVRFGWLLYRDIFGKRFFFALESKLARDGESNDVTTTDLLIRASSEEATIYDGNIVQNLVEGFVIHDRSAPGENEFQEISSPGCVSKTLKLMVVKLVDGYLAEMVTGFSRPSHDGLYHAIDMYLKEHPGISMSERKRIRRLMDYKRLSTNTCMHAVQNELLLRVVV
ncbi:hypothetical protein VitviT2T_004293 [Vitis vinifera]|uniref:NPH3 domain-containing protein n=1 Tax=Vitis vinifera TaxID=29760 RepID=A0ABY9BPT0_VITVI|nr:hypothetical protein VitviT2T_004293 [Vitis vinifera]